jgi:hypothetical protein
MHCSLEIHEKEKVEILKLEKGDRLAAKLLIRRIMATLFRRCEKVTLSFSFAGRERKLGFQFSGFRRLEI